MHDPRAPETLQWLASLPLTARLTVMHAMSFAFPLLKNDCIWMARVDAVLADLKPTAREHEDIVIEAVKVSVRLKLEISAEEPAQPVTIA